MISAIIELFGGRSRAGEERRSAAYRKIKELEKLTAEERLVALDGIRIEVQKSIFLNRSPILAEHISNIQKVSQDVIRTAIEINKNLHHLNDEIKTVKTSDAVLYINQILPVIKSLHSSRRDSLVSLTDFLLDNLRTRDLEQLEQEVENVNLVPAKSRAAALSDILDQFSANPFQVVQEHLKTRFRSSTARLTADLGSRPIKRLA